MRLAPPFAVLLGLILQLAPNHGSIRDRILRIALAERQIVDKAIV